MSQVGFEPTIPVLSGRRQFMPSTAWPDICSLHSIVKGARGSVVGYGIMLQAGRSRFRFPMRSLDFFQLT
jgi:hypothetical protein